jgi:hypothetical protein
MNILLGEFECMRKGVLCQEKGVLGCASEGFTCMREVQPCGTKAGPTEHLEDLTALVRGVPLVGKEA